MWLTEAVWIAEMTKFPKDLNSFVKVPVELDKHTFLNL